MWTEMTDPFLSEFAIAFNPDEFLVHPLADMAACNLNTFIQPSARSLNLADGWMEAFGLANKWMEAF
jgi:hypothetical protein